jgi:Tol biopolymer transport system component
VFSSTRQAYGRELSSEERRRLETDPSYFAEIYTMDADGGDVVRLTEVAGYDGGPFFTADGKSIVWRRFEPDGAVADVWIMGRDGSDARRLTSFGSMSWAPYPHPSGEYVIFTSNKHGFGNFELFLVDFAGTKEPVRVTCTDGFDGLPVPSPDGRKLAWTSNRRGTSQIFLGAWDHERALEAIRQAPLRNEAEP